MNEKVTRLAIASRIIILCIQFISNILIPDHIPDVFQSPRKPNDTEPLDKIPEFLLGGLKRWDAEYFLHIAEYGYTYENTLAFYPLFPCIVRFVTKAIYPITFYISYRYTALIVATILNIYFFYRAANCLYELTQKVFGDPTKAWNAVILFCFNPASIFFTAPYSEGLFSWLTFSLMLECVTELRLIKILCTLCLSILCRSNGIINIGYPIYFLLREILLSKKFLKFFKIFLIIIISILPIIYYNLYIYQLFCLEKTILHSSEIIMYAEKNDYVLSGSRNLTNSPWCDKIIPLSYSYIQKHYWNVGLLNYYEFKQIPNFLIASPILILFLTRSMNYLIQNTFFASGKGMFRTLLNLKSLPFIIHGLFLTIFSTLFIYIQVSNRLIASSSPCLYWFAADYLPKNFEGIDLSLPKFKSKRAIIVYWFGSYFIIGTLLFSNFYPWT